MSARTWTLYLLRCGDGSLYAGITNALEKRLATHASGKGARYTRSRLPVALAWSCGRQTARDARRLEWAVKQLSRDEKLALVAGDRALWRRLRKETLGAP